MEWRRVCSVDEDNDEVGVRGAGDHVAGILDMTRGVGNDEFTPRRRKIFVGDVDGNALFPFGAQAIREEGQVDPAVLFVAALPFECFQLVGQNAFAIVKEAADQGAFPVVDAACCDESE